MRQASAGAPLEQAEALALVQAVPPALAEALLVLAEAPLVLALAQAAQQASAEAPLVLALVQVSRLPLHLLKNLQKALKDASLT